MAAHAYSNEMLMRLDRFLDESLSLIIFVKEIIFLGLTYSEDTYIKQHIW